MWVQSGVLSGSGGAFDASVYSIHEQWRVEGLFTVEDLGRAQSGVLSGSGGAFDACDYVANGNVNLRQRDCSETGS